MHYQFSKKKPVKHLGGEMSVKWNQNDSQIDRINSIEKLCWGRLSSNTFLLLTEVIWNDACIFSHSINNFKKS